MIELIFHIFTSVHCLVFFSDREGTDLNREGHRHTVVYRHADPGIDTARSSARFEIHGPVLDAGEPLHDERLRDHALLRFQ